ncbi:hypothetical protein TraAM80_05957 [Trypanosoma rangeli]|uniref:BAR domain-containing protein n=1 Tax=Trypanosoma rangeli TaxID=5698 RepID=A0A3R7KX22_TRYRA|nr:uncharacterized protein TraAM80_05957 [Trypanosoma rangeli]RNF03080.1 hypothetical protein TraAM80_05957 [Trypanosoma rangeli]|eukprot:RNF03080.1 hypothetical protein TraAM80_05957 [Trypanosoma rangeli]
MSCCTTIPETVDKGLNENGECLERTAKAVRLFEKSIAETINLYQGLMNSFEKVASVFTELSDESDSLTIQLTRGFAEGMKKLRDGSAMSSLQMDVTQYVKEGIPPILAEHERLYKFYKRLREMKKKEELYRFKIGETEKEYARKNRPLAESKSYIKLGKSRDKASLKYQEKKEEFGVAMSHFKRLVASFLETSLPGYAACNSGFSRHLGEVMESYSSGGVLSKADNGSALHQPQHEMSEKADNHNAVQPGDGPKEGNPLTLEERYYSQEEWATQ